MPLIGRDDEIASIRSFFEGAGVRGGALLVVGEAGVGKSAVLDEFAAGEAGRGTRVLRAAGVQFEAEVGYSALNQLLFPLGEEMAALTDTHRTALRCALGFEVGPAPDRLVVSNAALLWLRAVAAETPLLIVIDDLHWVDRASAEVLGFVARRLVGSPIVFLAACRSADRGFFQDSGLAEAVLPPLPAQAARTLVDRHFPELSPAVRHRLLAEATGNPLALLELPSALDGDQRTDFTTLPEVLPLSDRLQVLFTSRVRGLPERCRLMMLLGALGGSVEVARLRTAGGETCDLDDLAPAEDARLVQVSDTRLGFRHPLIGAAVVEASAERERRWAHRALAGVVATPERRVWHLAESSVGVDADIAAQLDETAQALLRQGDALGAVAALTRAAELSPDPADRGRRLAEAAYVGADAGGELATASRLLGDARRSGSLPTHSLPGAAAAAHLLINSDGDVTTAHRLLAGAVEAGDHGFDADDAVLVEALLNLLLISWYVGTQQAWEIFHRLVGRLKPEPPPLLRVNATVFSDPARATDEDVAELDAVIDTVGGDEDPTRLIRIGTAAVFADRLPRLREAERHLAQSRHAGKGPARRHLGALMHLGIDGFQSGRWDEAWQFADEGLAVCTEHGLRFFHWYFHWVQALVAAGRGEVEAARQLTGEMTRWAIAHQAAGITYFAWQARALSDIGAGEYDDAYHHATQVSPPGELARYRPTALWAAPDLVEAALFTGRRAEASAHAAALREARLGKLSPRLRLVTAAATALTADDDTARERFEAALSGPALDRWPFDLARVRLAYGERLRRLRSTSAAREQLTIAHDTLAALGAVPWRDRAANELRATGLTRQSAPDAKSPLTPQEREIAELAGAGLTNKQIGQKLFISHRTVGDHLYKIFPKLGITSRAALRDALTAYDDRDRSDKPVM
ncbi:LuxR family transcriptional regulator [Amycolatopsis sp. DSM 110486]|uniref:helix-turn-helix transcriptional regulator n=1 Tax=Amycolatopsis sp. DSM 110486 TaxID=2865832 RepID=UPI001C69D2D7|nr:LuxR family transcriptional regulator [Amycolatopsis sp. DSM 110486]QYN18506.1 AAA family ATPase [Amycolatopsis sp. DSM 110486]